MISERSQELIGLLLWEAIQTSTTDGYREEYRTARVEFLTMVGNLDAAEFTDRTLVDDAVHRHAVEMLKLSTHKPHAGELFPSEPFAQAQWHLLRIEALRAAPLDVAAARLREEALNALTVKKSA